LFKYGLHCEPPSDYTTVSSDSNGEQLYKPGEFGMVPTLQLSMRRVLTIGAQALLHAAQYHTTAQRKQTLKRKREHVISCHGR
jgi:hypothetical protein